MNRPVGKLGNRANRLKSRRGDKLGENGTIGGAASREIRADGHVHLPVEADARHGHIHRRHGGASRLNGDVVAAARQKIQANAAFGIRRVRRRDRVESPGHAAHGRPEQKIGVSLVFERIAKLRALDAESRQGLAGRRLVPLLVLISDELFELDG